MRKLIGSYQLGPHNFRLYLDLNYDGGTVSRPKDMGTNKIVIGYTKSWVSTLQTLLHECYEAMYVEMQLRWTPDPSWSDESGNVLFVANHNQFDDLHGRVAAFLNEAGPALQKAWNKETEKQEKRNGKLRTNRRVVVVPRGRQKNPR